MSTIIYSIGFPPRQWTRLRLDASGDYELRSTVTADEQEHTYTGTLAPQRFAALTALLADGEPIWAVTHLRKRAPGEPPARIEVTTAADSAAAELWASEVPEVPAFLQATDLIIALIREISGGVVVEPGR